MRKIERTTRFRRDYKRESRGQYAKTLVTNFVDVLQLLVADEPLKEKHRDHALTGNWTDHRDCHIRPDLILIYRKPDDKILQLIRLGSHSELGL
ncbi:MAG: type II toxin-antitoxin system YafQ family toxin [Proteobacteria bacterium]|nr:type II toxin-antitoxin system YafQ family toxin [Pseudomonadota bacterium]